MKIVVAIDSFKGSMSSLEAGEAARQGILRACPDAWIDVRPLADGGEGTVSAIAKGCHRFIMGIGESATNGAGIDAFFPILRDVATLEEAMDRENAARNLADTAEQVFRLIKRISSY